VDYPLGAPPADLLWVLDEGPAMMPFYEQLVEQFGPILDDLVDRLDVHVGVVDMDCDPECGWLHLVVGERWIDRETPDPADAFMYTVLDVVFGLSQRQGIAATYAALEVEADGPNEGFRRDGAALAVVVVSNAPDETPSALITVPEFTEWFADAFVLPRFHSLVDHGPEPASSYTSLSAAFGGETADLLDDDWTPFLEAVADGLADGGGIVLSPAPPAVDVWAVPFGDAEAYVIDPTSVLYDPDTGDVHVEVPVGVVGVVVVPAGPAR
jgi:hypothetical protein